MHFPSLYSPRTAFCFIIILLFNILACNTKQRHSGFDYGSVNNNVYHNPYFGLSMHLPEGWLVQSREVADELTATSQELISGDDVKMKAMLQASETNIANLLTVFKYELGSASDFNPSLIMVAERTDADIKIRTGKDYLSQARKMLEYSQFKYDYIGKGYERLLIGKTEFYSLDTKLDLEQYVLKQKYFATVSKDHCISLIISWVDDGDYEVLMKSIKSIKISRY